MIGEKLQTQLALLPDYLSHHLLLSLSALAIGIIICLPLALIVTRYRALQWPTLTAAGIMQTIPGIALLALMVPLLGTIGYLPALIALVLYSMLPILRNTVTGIINTDPSLIEAARGIGMTSTQMLFRVELPLAIPIIIAGIRTAAVWVVGTATLSTPVGATSLGNFIFPGLQTQNTTAVIVGSVAAASLAIVLDQLIRLVELAAIRRSRPLYLLAGTALIVMVGLGLSPLISANSGNQDREIVVVGAKQFTEQYILADLTADILTEAGYEVDSRNGLGSMILFEALGNGTIDCYIDYSGTIWANVLNRQDNPSAEEVLSEVTRLLQKDYGITCLGRLGFENAYALAIRRSTADSLSISSIHQLALHARRLTIGSDYDFFSRPEWSTLRDAYDLRFGQKRQFDPTLMYAAIAAREVDVISAYSTDGRIVAYDLKILEDPLGSLPPYDAIILLSPQAAGNTRLVEALSQLLGTISDEDMRLANKLIDIDHRPISEAAAYLASQMTGKQAY